MGAPGNRSVMTRFHLRVTLLVGVLLVIWAALTAAVLLGVLGGPGFAGPWWSAGPWWLAALGLVIVVVAFARAASFARAMAAENGGLRTALADLRHADQSAAAAEAGVRDGLRQVLVSLGRRNQSLIHRQLRIIDKLEKQASGSAELGDLFTLDHLTTRMRRHAESLTVLAGETPGRSWGTPVPVLDVMRAAAAEVEDYRRVLVRSGSDSSVAAPAVTDLIHLLAELIENATLFSPSTTKVEVRADPAADGFFIEIEDRGLGIPADQLRVLNARLAEAPDEELADADRLGLFVAARLAARHGVGVSLSPSPHRGTRAVVVLPADLVVAPGSPGRRSAGERDAAGPGRLDLQAPGILALAGGERARRTDPVTAGPSVFTPSLESLSSPTDADWFTAPGPAAPPSAVPPSAAPPPAPPPDPAPPSPAAAPAKPELPRRVRSAANRPATRSAPPDSPVPDQARSLASSLQSSWRRSETDDPGRGLADEEES